MLNICNHQMQIKIIAALNQNSILANMWSNLNSHILWVVMSGDIIPLGKNLALSNKAKTCIPYEHQFYFWLSILVKLLLMYPGLRNKMFRASLFVIAKTWKQLIFPWMAEQKNKLWLIFMIEYYKAMKIISYNNTQNVNKS